MRDTQAGNEKCFCGCDYFEIYRRIDDRDGMQTGWEIVCPHCHCERNISCPMHGYDVDVPFNTKKGSGRNTKKGM